jgi:hypothetical protein
MYSCLYNTCADIKLFICVCRDGFWRTSGTSFRGIVMMSSTLPLPRFWINGNLPRVLLILDTTEMSLIRWSILMSSGGRTRDDEMWRPFRTYVGTPDGSWLAKTGGSVSCQSEFLGSTGMSRLFKASYRHCASWSLLYMSSTSKRGWSSSAWRVVEPF